MEWFIDVNGSKIGPYTEEQIRGLLDEGELLPEHRVTSAHLGGAWITIAQLTQPSIGGFNPPPRPSNDSLKDSIQKPAGDIDAAFSLFDAIQSAKERQQGPRLPADATGPKKPWYKRLAIFLQSLTPQQRFALGGVLATLLVIWVGSKLLKKDSPPATTIVETPTQTESASSAPRAATKTAPVTSAPVTPNLQPLNPRRAETAPVQSDEPAEDQNDSYEVDERISGDTAGDPLPMDHDPVPMPHQDGETLQQGNGVQIREPVVQPTAAEQPESYEAH